MDLIFAGYGGWGRRAIRAAARAFDLVAIIEPNEQGAQAAWRDWGNWGVVVYPTLAEALEQGARADACWIATPIATHADVALEAIQGDLHVLIEKPFTTDLKVAAAIAGVAKEKELALMVGHLSLYSKMLSHAQEFYLPGMQIVVIRRNDTGPSEADGDVLWGLGPHDIAALLDLAGEPQSINATGTRHRTCVQLGWENGTEALVELDWLAMKRERVFDVGFHECAPYWDEGAEPLLTEALAFRDICLNPTGDEAQEKIREALAVTSLLERISLARDQASVRA